MINFLKFSIFTTKNPNPEKSGSRRKNPDFRDFGIPKLNSRSRFFDPDPERKIPIPSTLLERSFLKNFSTHTLDPPPFKLRLKLRLKPRLNLMLKHMMSRKKRDKHFGGSLHVSGCGDL